MLDFIPKIGSICWIQLYDGHIPRLCILNNIASNHFIITLDVNKTNPEKREIKFEHIETDGFLFFNESVESTYYYQVIELANNGYDGVDVIERDVFMSLSDAFDYAEKEDLEICVRKFS